MTFKQNPESFNSLFSGRTIRLQTTCTDKTQVCDSAIFLKEKQMDQPELRSVIINLAHVACC